MQHWQQPHFTQHHAAALPPGASFDVFLPVYRLEWNEKKTCVGRILPPYPFYNSDYHLINRSVCRFRILSLNTIIFSTFFSVVTYNIYITALFNRFPLPPLYLTLFPSIQQVVGNNRTTEDWEFQEKVHEIVEYRRRKPPQHEKVPKRRQLWQQTSGNF